MDDIISKIPLYILLPSLIVVLILLVFLAIKAFYEGREISFWPPKIGARPAQEKIENKTTGALTKSTTDIKTLGTERDVFEYIELKQQLKLSDSHNTNIRRDSLAQINVSDLDVFSADSIEVIIKTDHSIIEKRLVQGEYYVVKKTNSTVCQLEALEQLVGKEFIGYDEDITATFISPLKVWLKDNYVWELHPYYEGISLLELIKKNKYPIQAQLLGLIFNVLIRATSQLHEEGILHRDINPSNILITTSGQGTLDLLVLDCSFCCRMNSTQVAFGTSTYTAPEQLQGRATYQSDWYSIAATVFFLANGFPPDRRVEQRFKSGLQNISFGGLRPLSDFRPRVGGFLGFQHSAPKLIEALLEPNETDRPEQKWEVLLNESSLVTEFYEIIGILDMGKFGWLVTQEYDFHVVPNDKIKDFLSLAFSHKAIKAPSVLADAKRLLGA